MVPETAKIQVAARRQRPACRSRAKKDWFTKTVHSIVRKVGNTGKNLGPRVSLHGWNLNRPVPPLAFVTFGWETDNCQAIATGFTGWTNEVIEDECLMVPAGVRRVLTQGHHCSHSVTDMVNERTQATAWARRFDTYLRLRMDIQPGSSLE